jgi:hypothetical protein
MCTILVQTRRETANMNLEVDRTGQSAAYSLKAGIRF